MWCESVTEVRTHAWGALASVLLTWSKRKGLSLKFLYLGKGWKGRNLLRTAGKMEIDALDPRQALFQAVASSPCPALVSCTSFTSPLKLVCLRLSLDHQDSPLSFVLSVTPVYSCINKFLSLCFCQSIVGLFQQTQLSKPQRVGRRTVVPIDACTGRKWLCLCAVHVSQVPVEPLTCTSWAALLCRAEDHTDWLELWNCGEMKCSRSWEVFSHLVTIYIETCMWPDIIVTVM